MKIEASKIPGVFVLQTDAFPDNRGAFVKLFSKTEWQEADLLTNFVESYYSISHKGVIRGMHFQIPPHDHTKVVYVPYGKITDVLLDIRVGSPTFGQFESYEVSAENHRVMYIPPGIAHGFESLEENTIVNYLQNTQNAPGFDKGINLQSFGMKWQTSSPIWSEKDQKAPTLAEFESPFSFA